MNLLMCSKKSVLLRLFSAVLVVLCVPAQFVDAKLYGGWEFKVPEQNRKYVDGDGSASFSSAALPQYQNPSSYPDHMQSHGPLWFSFDGQGHALELEANFSASPNKTWDEDGRCVEEYMEIYDAKYPHFRLQILCGKDIQQVRSYTDTVIVSVKTHHLTDDREESSWSISAKHGCGVRDLKCPSDRSQCVPVDKICDGVPDCHSGEDEICTVNCGRRTPKPITVKRDASLRIVNGVEAEPGAWPWQVLVTYFKRNWFSNEVFYCGGSVIAPQWILTAAHCCKNEATKETLEAEFVTVTAGLHDKDDRIDLTMIRKVKKLYIDPFYNDPVPKANDFCLLLLAEPYPLNDKMQALCLPQGQEPLVGQKCIAIGWGYDKIKGDKDDLHGLPLTSKLQQVDLAVTSDSDCEAFLVKNLTPEIMCASGATEHKAICSGDSGGSLMCAIAGSSPVQFEVTGVTSFGAGCGNRPGAFARTRHGMQFIVETLYENLFYGWFTNISFMHPDVRPRTVPSTASTKPPETSTTTSSETPLPDWDTEEGGERGDADLKNAGTSAFDKVQKFECFFMTAFIFSALCLVDSVICVTRNL